MSFRWISLGLAATVSCLGAAEPSPVTFQPPVEKGHLHSPAVAEASGIAVSPVNPDFLWIVNDSGAKAEIHLAGSDGSDRGKITLKDATNIDWEDLVSFKLDGKSYLLVADTGDNGAVRPSCTFYIVREPALPAAGKSLDLTLSPAWRIDFQYEGGPRDCESAAVDAAARRIVFLSKRTKPPELYELPLRAPEKGGLQIAKATGRAEVKAPVKLPFIDQPTGMDISADGSRAAVITYYGVFVFPRTSKESWAEAFARKPAMLAPHQLAQAESVAFSRDGRSIIAVSEGVKSPIRIYQETPAKP